MTVVMVGLGMLWVPFIRYLSTEVYIYLQSVQAYISPPIAAVFLFGCSGRAPIATARSPRSSSAPSSAPPVSFSSSTADQRARWRLVAADAFVTINFLHFAILLSS